MYVYRARQETSVISQIRSRFLCLKEKKISLLTYRYQDATLGLVKKNQNQRNIIYTVYLYKLIYYNPGNVCVFVIGYAEENLNVKRRFFFWHSFI